MTGGDVDRALRAADAYLDAGNSNAAIDAARDVLASDPQNIQALELNTRALAQKGDAGAAEEAADRLIEAAPEYDAGYRYESNFCSSWPHNFELQIDHVTASC